MRKRVSESARFSLSLKFVLIYFFLSILNVALVTLLMYENQIDLTIQTFHYRIENYASLFSELLMGDSKRCSFDDSTGCKATIESADTEGNITSYELFDLRGDVLLSSHADTSFTQQDLLRGIRAYSSSYFNAKKYHLYIDEKAKKIDVYLPLFLASGAKKVLHYTMPVNKFDQLFTQLYLSLLSIAGVISFIHLVVLGAILRVVLIPIRRMSKSAEQIAAGNYDVTVPSEQHDEIGVLARSFAIMASSIREKILTLERNEIIHQREIQTAGYVQKLIFSGNTETKHLDLALFFKPYTHVSGDYYECVQIDSEKTGLFLVDATGHGVPAALITMMARDMFYKYVFSSQSPADVMRKVNLEVTDVLNSRYISGFFFTALYLIYNHRTSSVSFCNAGHINPIYVNSRKQSVTSIRSRGILVGVSKTPSEDFKDVSFEVSKGDKIVLMSDGISEERGKAGKNYGFSFKQRILQKNSSLSARELLEKLKDDFSSHADIEHLHDDATLIVAEIK